MGSTLNIQSPGTWFAAAAVFAVGYALFELVRRRFKQEWGTIQEEIEKELQRRGNV